MSPVPDVQVYEITPGVDKFLIIASDGLWAVMTVKGVVKFIHNCDAQLGDVSGRYAINIVSLY